MDDLSLSHLRTLTEVAACGSFSQAALKLGVTQPAVSLQIRNLERRLSIRLIERVGKRAMPTAAGIDLLESARRIEAEAGAAVARMQAYHQGKLGRVRMGAGATACIYLLPRVLAALRAAHPGLEITIVTGNTADLSRAVEDNTLDLAFVTLPVSRRALAVREILDDPLVAVFPPADVIPRRTLGPRHFADKTLILYERGGMIRAIIDRWFASAGVPAKPAMELGNVEATKSLVAAGLGCSILPSVAVARKDRDRPLLVRDLAPALSRKLGLILRQDKVLDPALRTTIKAIERLRPAALRRAAR
jgi:DNA-binding transcriptional LysR family regulator